MRLLPGTVDLPDEHAHPLERDREVALLHRHRPSASSRSSRRRPLSCVGLAIGNAGTLATAAALTAATRPQATVAPVTVSITGRGGVTLDCGPRRLEGPLQVPGHAKAGMRGFLSVA
jgi:hypothetical protein